MPPLATSSTPTSTRGSRSAVRAPPGPEKSPRSTISSPTTMPSVLVMPGTAPEARTMAPSMREVVDLPLVPVMIAVGMPWTVFQSMASGEGSRRHPTSGFPCRARRRPRHRPRGTGRLGRQRRVRAEAARASFAIDASDQCLNGMGLARAIERCLGIAAEIGNGVRDGSLVDLRRGVQRIRRRREGERSAAVVEPHSGLGLAPADLAAKLGQPLAPRLRQRLGVVVVHGDLHDGAGAVEEEAGAGEASGVGELHGVRDRLGLPPESARPTVADSSPDQGDRADRRSRRICSGVSQAASPLPRRGRHARRGHHGRGAGRRGDRRSPALPRFA